MKLKVVLRAGESPQRRCRAEVPVLPGCFSEGDTPEEAMANIREAIASYFDTTEPPRGGTDRVEEIELSVRLDEFLKAPADEAEGSDSQELALYGLRRFPMEHGRHETAALVAVTAGLFGAMFCGSMAVAPIWIGFLVGYLAMASFAALVCTVDI